MVFTDASTLNGHKDSHFTVEAYACNICCKRFKRRQTSNAHMRKHRELTEHAVTKRFTCDIFNKSFLRRTDVIRHKFTVH